jgi:lysophospholipase L1-like esterase
VWRSTIADPPPTTRFGGRLPGTSRWSERQGLPRTLRDVASVRYVAIGDSFTEGVGDELPDGTVRGWADLVAQGWAESSGEAIEYANLAIRGKLIRPIVEQQLEPALALRPTHLSFNGGGNDMLRPRTSISSVVDSFSHVLKRCDEEGVTLILLSGANPSGQLPLSRVIQRRGDLLSAEVVARIADRPDVIRALNWPDRELSSPPYWSEDRLHMNSRGHHRVAARVLDALGLEPPAAWWALPELTDAALIRGAAYYRAHVGPWVRRRLTGTSSGDGRAAKYGAWTTVTPSAG